MKLAVVFAALVSVFGFSSCLNSDGDNSPMPAYVVGTFNLGMSGYEFKPDFFDVTYETGVYDLTQYGIASTFNGGRGVICFTVPEGTEITENTKRVKVQLQAGCWALPSKKIVGDAAAYADYTSKIAGFTAPGVGYSYLSTSPAWVKDRTLNLCFGYTGDDKTEYVLCADKVSTVSQDTLYLDLKVKTTGTTSNILALDTYSLSPIMDKIMELEPKDEKDSIYFVIRGTATEYANDKIVTTLVRTVKQEASY